MGALKNITTRKFKKFKEGWELHKYDRFTIADYFRRQGAQVGEGCSIIPTSLGTEPYLVKIGNHVTIASNVRFITHDGGAWLFRKEFPDLQVFGPIIVEDNCVIGENALLLPNIRIGPNSIVAAGSVVISDIPPDCIAIGVPARPFGSVQKYREKCLARWHEQRPQNIVIEDGADWWSSAHYRENVKNLHAHLLELFWRKANV